MDKVNKMTKIISYPSSVILRLVGNALYPTFALFNHSCDNNTYKYFAGNKVVVIASKV